MISTMFTLIKPNATMFIHDEVSIIVLLMMLFLKISHDDSHLMVIFSTIWLFELMTWAMLLPLLIWVKKVKIYCLFLLFTVIVIETHKIYLPQNPQEDNIIWIPSLRNLLTKLEYQLSQYMRTMKDAHPLEGKERK